MKNNIKYIGNVRIKIKGRTASKRHNSGLPEFFNVLRDIIITAADLKTTRLPFYMSIIKSPTGNDTTDDKFFQENISYNDPTYDNLKLLLSPLLITSRKQSEEDGSCILSALLPQSLTITNSLGANVNISDVYTLLLGGDEQRKVLAFSKTNYDTIKTIFEEQNSQAIIEWELTFANKENS